MKRRFADSIGLEIHYNQKMIKISPEAVWVAVGLTGQAIFGARFIIQWLYSEAQKKSVIPVSFWYLSLVGSFILLAYAIYKKDPVFILGFCLNSVVYIRNLMLIKKEKSQPTT